MGHFRVIQVLAIGEWLPTGWAFEYPIRLRSAVLLNGRSLLMDARVWAKNGLAGGRMDRVEAG